MSDHISPYLSGRQKILKIGVPSYTENDTSLQITGKVAIGTESATASLDVAGDVRLRGNLGIGTSIPLTPFQVERYGVKTGFGTFIASAGISTDVDEFLVADTNFQTAEYTVHIQSSSSIQTQKVLVMQNEVDAVSQEYAIMYQPTHILSIAATVSGGLCKLQVTPDDGVTGMVTYRFSRETML